MAEQEKTLDELKSALFVAFENAIEYSRPHKGSETVAGALAAQGTIAQGIIAVIKEQREAEEAKARQIDKPRIPQ